MKAKKISTPPPVKRVALFLRPKAAQQTTTPKGGGFVLPGRVKQSRHEVPIVSFCDPVQSTGFPKQTINNRLYLIFVFFYLLCNFMNDIHYSN